MRRLGDDNDDDKDEGKKRFVELPRTNLAAKKHTNIRQTKDVYRYGWSTPH